MTSYIHEIYNESGPNMAAMKAVLHNLYFQVTLAQPPVDWCWAIPFVHAQIRSHSFTELRVWCL